MILITDSGSTKADWALVDQGVCVSRVKTCGFNPYMQTADEMVCRLKDSALQKIADNGVEALWFYGAGCTPGEKSESVAMALRAVFGRECKIHVESDMLGAARALCQDKEGIACILGTGSNSCLYDGRKIVAQVPPLGYILGDEGSGAHLGKLLVGDILKRQMPREITEAFFDELGMTMTDIIDKVYRQPFPNRWLASLSPFIHLHLANEAVREMAMRAFTAFFTRNVCNYDRPDLPVGLVGSVAYYYQEVIREAADKLGLTIGQVRQTPMEGLILELELIMDN
ncbi:MAG: ATPase [Bacteroidaceae bacterium]|nr:ATPase [Bacteroidaceae bacterium]